MKVGDWELTKAVEPVGFLIASKCTVCSRPFVGDASVQVMAAPRTMGGGLLPCSPPGP